MYQKSRKLLLASGIALAIAGISGNAVAQNAAQVVTEARQETQIWTTYALSPYLRANDIKVSVDNGKATLTGKVNEEVNKDLARQIALGVEGIKRVDNQIVVESDYVPPQQRTAGLSYGQRIDDATITTTVKSKLVWSKYADAMATNVDTELGKVTLRGSAQSESDKELAGLLAKHTSGVISVDNQLVVKGAKPAAADAEDEPSRDAGQAIADTWITTKVKSMFMYSSTVSGSDISVNSRSGIVTLSGKLGSGAERALAIELAQNVRGVKRVDAKALTI